MSDHVTLAHGSGGIEMLELLNRLIFKRVKDEYKRVENGYGIDVADDAAAIPIPGGKYIIVSTDSYTVNPPFFPGGNIGVLAACGSINDVLMMGGKPVAIVDAIVVEEGFPISDLEVIIDSMIKILEEEKIALIGGDFKVMPRGHLDRIVITTTAIGISEGPPIVDNPQPGDKIIVSSPVGDHGAVILLSQLGLYSELREAGLLKSDVKPLTRLMLPLLDRYRPCITAARDPTRGGLAGILNEWASKTNQLIVIRDVDVPVREPVRKYVETLGIDPYYLASEGVAVLSVRPECAEEILEFIHKLGFTEARIIGEVKKPEMISGYVVAETPVGGLRVVEPPQGELVPRIC